MKAFVHRYKESHVNKRRKFRRMLKDGKAVLLERRSDGWLYEFTPPPRQGANPAAHNE